MSHAPPNWVFSVFSFIGFILCCIPFPWHIAAWNTGTCLYMAWTGLTCLVLFVNSIVWNGNAINLAPVWCDISSRLYVGVAVAIPATSLCIARRLYRIAAVRNIMITKPEKRQAVLIDVAIGLGLPVLCMILQYIQQGHRFNIFEDIGCFPYTYLTPVGIVLIFIPPVLIGWICTVYGVMGVLAFNKSRKQFNELLPGSRLTNHRYVRLMCLAGFGSFATVILGTITLIRNINTGIFPWNGWADTHADFSRVDKIPAIFWRSSPEVEAFMELSRWLNVFCAFTFFGFFGFAQEAHKNYHSIAKFLAKLIAIPSTTSFTSSFFNSNGSKSGIATTGGNATLPVYIQSHTIRKVDDFDTISSMFASALSEEKAKSFPLSLSSRGDAGDTFADYKAEPYSPSPNSSRPPSPGHPPGLPHTSRPGSVMDNPSVCHLDVHERPVGLQPMLDIASAPRHPTDTPSGVQSNSDDIV